MPFRSCHRTPRAGVDPIRGQGAAMRVVRLAMHDPPIAETILLLLDHEHRGVRLVVVTGTDGDDDVLDVVGRLGSMAAADEVDALVVASVRPGGGLQPADADRWLEMSDECELIGIELVEWVIVGERVACPRDLLGESPRWSR
jgi:DNA repair protein RadC